MNPDDDVPERQLEDLETERDALSDRIDDAREDWERKKADPSVPGAGGDPLAAHSDHPEDQYPAKGGSESLGEDLEASDRLDPDDPANEDL